MDNKQRKWTISHDDMVKKETLRKDHPLHY
jgi:hypothetical protein